MSLNCMLVQITCSRGEQNSKKWSEESPSTAVVIAVPEYGNGRSSPRARPWSEQSPWSELSPSERMVWAVPEHKSGLGSARAQKVVWAVPEHSSGQGKSTVTCAACTNIWCIYFSLFSAKSSLTRLVKKANRYSTSFCLLIFFWQTVG